MLDYQQSFIKLAIDQGALCFGEFKLKSGRISPYFFNMGYFNSGARIAQLGKFYATALYTKKLTFDMLFGPAYKGIPLVISTASAFAQLYGWDIPFAFNRKETKDHGEGGQLVGADLTGQVVLVDDVITAGTALRQVLPVIKQAGANPVALLVALDRQEQGQGSLSAITEIEQSLGIQVFSIIKLEHILTYLAQQPDLAGYIPAIAAYQTRYGV
jgi:orotate phosphoribosyltransferase